MLSTAVKLVGSVTGPYLTFVQAGLTSKYLTKHWKQTNSHNPIKKTESQVEPIVKSSQISVGQSTLVVIASMAGDDRRPERAADQMVSPVNITVRHISQANHPGRHRHDVHPIYHCAILETAE